MLKNSLSRLESSMRQMGELLDVEQQEMDRMHAELEKQHDRMYVKTSDETGIIWWEKEYGLVHNSSLTLAQKKARVMAKMNSGETATPPMLAGLVRQVIDADYVDIIEYPSEYYFEIWVGTQYLVENLQIARDAVDEARPAHLDFEFVNAMKRLDKMGLYIGIAGAVTKKIHVEVSTDGLYPDE